MQLYVMVPGKPDPQLMTIDEAVEKIQKGELPNDVDVVKVGESNWAFAKDFPEIAARLNEGGVPPPPPPPPPRTTSTEPTAAATAAPAKPPATAVIGSYAKQAWANRGLRIGLGAGLGLLLLGIGALTLYRNSYSHGLVLEHIPNDCADLVYVDLEGIASSDPVKPALDKFTKNAKDLATDDQTVGHKDKDRIQGAIDAFKKNGVDEYTVREIAVCIRPSDDKDKHSGNLFENGLVVVGGTFRKADALGAIKTALESALDKDDVCKIEDDDMKLLKCSVDKGESATPIYAAMLEGRVLAISADKKLLKSVRNAKNVAKDYGIGNGVQFMKYSSKDAMSYDGTWGTTTVRIGSADTTLTIELYYDPDKGKAKLAEIKDPDAFIKRKEAAFKSAAKSCFTNSPFDMLSDAVDGATVEAYEDGVKYEYKASNKDLAKAVKYMADADMKDFRRLGDLESCVERTVDGNASNLPTPGYYNKMEDVDY